MAMVGMDVEQIRGVASQLQAQSEQINSVISTIESLISSSIGSSWVGTDATQFQDWWNSQHRPALQSAQEAIAGLGQSALNNADQQEQVSAG
jgi:WXG100 family type VII secretion target